MAADKHYQITVKLRFAALTQYIMKAALLVVKVKKCIHHNTCGCMGAFCGRHGTLKVVKM